MLSKKQKIGRKVFPRVLSSGKALYSPLFTLRFSLDEEHRHTESRFSFVVSSKVAKTAVARNKLKRRGYAIIRKHSKHIAPGYLAVFFFKKPAHSVSFLDLEREVVSVLTMKKIH